MNWVFAVFAILAGLGVGAAFAELHRRYAAAGATLQRILDDLDGAR